MNLNVDWQSLGAIVAIAVVAAAVIYRLIHGKLRDEFVLQRDHDDLEKRVGTMEKQQGDAPGHTDFRALSERVGDVERGVAVAQTSLDGMGTGIKRVEHLLDLLVEHQLGASRQ